MSALRGSKQMEQEEKITKNISKEENPAAKITATDLPTGEWKDELLINRIIHNIASIFGGSE